MMTLDSKKASGQNRAYYNGSYDTIASKNVTLRSPKKICFSYGVYLKVATNYYTWDRAWAFMFSANTTSKYQVPPLEFITTCSLRITFSLIIEYDHANYSIFLQIFLCVKYIYKLPAYISSRMQSGTNLMT